MTKWETKLDFGVAVNSLKVLVLTGPGTNCDAESLFAFRHLGANASEESLRLLCRHPEKLHEHHILVLPGGFTYGDYVGAGTLFAADFKHILGNEIEKFLAEGKFIIGICNGFQILVKSGLLPGFSGHFDSPSVTLAANESLKFEDRWVYLKPEAKNFWTKGLPKVITLPVAHAEGRFICKNKKNLQTLESGAQILLRYSTSSDDTPKYPDNPNGSTGHIAAITNPSGQVMGLMPHPERFILAHQHPAFARGIFKGEPHGLILLRNLVKEAASRF